MADESYLQFALRTDTSRALEWSAKQAAQQLQESNQTGVEPSQQANASDTTATPASSVTSNQTLSTEGGTPEGDTLADNLQPLPHGELWTTINDVMKDDYVVELSETDAIREAAVKGVSTNADDNAALIDVLEDLKPSGAVVGIEHITQHWAPTKVETALDEAIAAVKDRAAFLAEFSGIDRTSTDGEKIWTTLAVPVLERNSFSDADLNELERLAHTAIRLLGSWETPDELEAAERFASQVENGINAVLGTGLIDESFGDIVDLLNQISDAKSGGSYIIG